jgi:hypothetical protein
MDSIGGMAGIGVVTGVIMVAVRRTPIDPRWTALLALAIGAVLGLAWQQIGWLAKVPDATPLGQYLGAAVVGLWSAAAAQGLISTAERVTTNKHASRLTTFAHGYGTGVLKQAPANQADADRVLREISAALQTENNKFPAKYKAKYPSKQPEPAPKLELSLMEDTPRHKQNTQYPGKDLILFVSFNPVPRGYDVAHEHVHDLAATIDSNSNVAAGLGNHFCCYIDQGG